MYVCLCNPFTDKDVKRVLDSGTVKKTPGAVYKACSGGVKPCCASCTCMVKDIMQAHEEQHNALPLAAE